MKGQLRPLNQISDISIILSVRFRTTELQTPYITHLKITSDSETPKAFAIL